jgi:23S rRNA (pseudouridine1915-N3)-methyltransferase
MDSQVAIALGKERDLINKKIPDGAVTVALCVDGRGMDRGASRLCFIIGGSFGLHEDVENGADLKLSMSKMTFPHHLARIMLLEQLYRSFKIAEGGKYHK